MEVMYIIHLSSLIKSYLSVFLEVSESRDQGPSHMSLDSDEQKLLEYNLAGTHRTRSVWLAHTDVLY
jgi:hypothetical protein